MPSDEDYLAMSAGRNGGLDTSQSNLIMDRNADLRVENERLEQEIKDLKQAIYVGKEIVAARDREIESLTAQLAEAREAMLHAHGFIRARRQDIHDEGCGCCDCVMLTELKAAIEAAGGVK